MLQSGRIPFAVSLKAISQPHLESWQRMRPLFLRRETKVEGDNKRKIKNEKIIDGGGCCGNWCRDNRMWKI